MTARRWARWRSPARPATARTLYEKSNYRLPLALTSGERVELLSAGAYVTTYASQRFNGFAPLAEHYL